jgi:hypothetical protein
MFVTNSLSLETAMPFARTALISALLAALTAAPALAGSPETGSRVTVTDEGRLIVNGQPYFFVGMNPGPPVDLKTPEGGDGWAELADYGVRAVRGEGAQEALTPEGEAAFRRYLDVLHAHGMFCSPMLGELVRVNKPGRREQLTKLVERFKDHPGIFFWKSADEPEWGKVPAAELTEACKLIHQLDANHPVWTAHAPRGTLETLRPYNDTGDVLAIDVYPVSEPPGKHSLEANKALSMVGDYTRRIVTLADMGGSADGPTPGKKARFMILQGACWSGVAPIHNPKNRFMEPTFREERYMTYQAIINGADSVAYFGMTGCLLGRDLELGFNWTWFRAVLRPLLAEFRPGSELYPVLIAPNSKYPLEFTGGPQIEARWKEMGPYLYIFAAAREGEPVDVRFAGLQDGEVSVLFENRTIDTKAGAFTDRFAAHDVHIYRALRVLPADLATQMGGKKETQKRKNDKTSKGQKVETSKPGEYYRPPGATE